MCFLSNSSNYISRIRREHSLSRQSVQLHRNKGTEDANSSGTVLIPQPGLQHKQ